MWSDAALSARMAKGWGGGRREGTPCGGGSRREHTANIRQWIPRMMLRYGLLTVCDAGAGDLFWARDTFAGFEYQSFDLVPLTPEVTALDISKQRLPTCDLIVCRAVLIHLDPARIIAALDLFRKSGRYLMATTEPGNNLFDPCNQCNPVNLSHAPYNMGAPIERIADLEGPDSYMGLWRLDALQDATTGPDREQLFRKYQQEGTV